MTEKQKKLVSVLAVLGVIVFTVVVFFYAGIPMIRLVEDPGQYREMIQGKGIIAQLSFVAMVFFQVVVAIIPGEPLEICAGYAFGAVEGTILSMLGIALGSAVIFLLVRTLGVKLVEVFFPVEKIGQLRFLRTSRKRNVLTFTIMLIPGTPKDLLSYFAGLTGMRFREWMVISTVARIPSILSSAVGGSALARQEYSLAAIVFAVTAGISLLGLLIYNRISKQKEQ